MEISINTVKDLVTLVGFISLLTGGVLYIKALHANNEARAKENRVIIEALFALVDEAKKRGCNGPITEAHRKLQKVLLDKVSDD